MADDDKQSAQREQASGERPMLGVVRTAQRQYTVITQRDDSDGGFVASCVELPGSVSQGATEAEAVKNALDALEARRKNARKSDDDASI